MGKEKEMLRNILANTELIMAHLKITPAAQKPNTKETPSTKTKPEATKKPAAKKSSGKSSTKVSK